MEEKFVLNSDTDQEEPSYTYTEGSTLILELEEGLKIEVPVNEEKSLTLFFYCGKDNQTKDSYLSFTFSSSTFCDIKGLDEAREIKAVHEGEKVKIYFSKSDYFILFLEVEKKLEIEYGYFCDDDRGCGCGAWKDIMKFNF